MDSYNGTTDPDEHIENIEAVLTYRSVQGAVKCKLFVTTLRRGGVTWFKNLRRNSIDSWSDLCDEFMTHFTASRTQPKMVASLEAIVQGKSEPLRDYIERFNKEAVPHCEGSARRHRRQEGCPPRSPKTLNEFLAIAKIYIRYEEEVYVGNINKSRKEDSATESSKRLSMRRRRKAR